MGPNAIGKSNLLDAFRFLRDLTLEGGGLARAVELRDGMAAVRRKEVTLLRADADVVNGFGASRLELCAVGRSEVEQQPVTRAPLQES